jgi:hypothetical protein
MLWLVGSSHEMPVFSATNWPLSGSYHSSRICWMSCNRLSMLSYSTSSVALCASVTRRIVVSNLIQNEDIRIHQNLDMHFWTDLSLVLDFAQTVRDSRSVGFFLTEFKWCGNWLTPSIHADYLILDIPHNETGRCCFRISHFCGLLLKRLYICWTVPQ